MSESEKIPQLERRDNNTVEIETPEARFKIVYSDHAVENDPRIVDSVDVLILETSSRPTDETGVKDIMRLGIAQQYRRLIIEAEGQTKPIYLVDVTMSKADIDREDGMEKTDIARAIEGGFGLVALGHTAKRIYKSKESINRREFFKRAGLLGAGTYLTAPSAARELVNVKGNRGEPNEASILRKTGKIEQKAVDATHLELDTILVHGRNQLIAQKAISIARLMSLETKKKPVIAVVIGGAHVGIEGALQDTEENRIAKLKVLFGDKLKNETGIIRVDYIPEGKKDGNHKVTFYEDATLAKQIPNPK